MIDNFEILEKIGEGAYSGVYKVKRKSDGKEYALKRVKLMNLNEKEKENAMNEIRILASIRHPNVICYKEAFWENRTNSLCIIMEFCNDGDLFQKIRLHTKKGKHISEKEIWNLAIQMIRGLKELHDKKIFHRDIKSANVFLDKNGIVKIGDMNVSKVAKKGLLYTQTGTPYYASPEVWKDQPYDCKSDIWSLGCIIYEMASLKPPFRANDMEGLYKKVIKGYYQKLPSDYSNDFNEFISLMLKVKPSQRPNCDQLLNLPIIVNRINEKVVLDSDEILKPDLLATIKIPINLHYLTDKLPKANYDPIKTKTITKPKTISNGEDFKGNYKRNFSENKEIERSNLKSINSKNSKSKLPIIVNNNDYINSKNYSHKKKYLNNNKKTNLNEKYKDILSKNYDINIKKKIENIKNSNSKNHNVMKIYGLGLNQNNKKPEMLRIAPKKNPYSHNGNKYFNKK